MNSILGTHEKKWSLSLRLMAYIVLFEMILASGVYWYVSSYSSFSENLFAGAIETFVVILGFDLLLSFDRKRRIMTINTQKSNEIKSNVVVSVTKVSEVFGENYDSVLNIIDCTNKELLKMTNDMLHGQGYAQFKESVFKGTSNAQDDLIKFSKEMAVELDEKVKSLKEITPYPDPRLLKQLSDARVGIEVFIALENIFIQIGKQRDKFPEKAKSLDLHDIWTSILLSPSDNGSLDRYDELIKSSYDALLEIHKRAELNNLHFEV